MFVGLCSTQKVVDGTVPHLQHVKVPFCTFSLAFALKLVYNNRAFRANTFSEVLYVRNVFAFAPVPQVNHTSTKGRHNLLDGVDGHKGRPWLVALHPPVFPEATGGYVCIHRASDGGIFPLVASL